MTNPVETNVAAEVAGAAPSLRVFGMVAANLPNYVDEAALSEIQEAALASLRSLGIESEKLSEIEPFASWRKVFGAMGLQPSKYRSSVEALVRRALKASLPTTGVPVVDIYNAASVRFLTPMGGYDLAKLQGRIELRPVREGDAFDPLGGDASAFPLTGRVLVYADAQRVICYGLNHRDSKQTSIDSVTTDAVFFAESLDRASPAAARVSLRWLSTELEGLGALCGTIFEATPHATQGAESWDETV